jgi:hypothetical protein
MIFNEAELAGNMSVRGLSQGITAPTNITTTSMFAENKKDESIATRIRKIIFKITFKAELPKEAVGVIKVSAKLIDVVASCWDPNIVYEDLIEEDPTLLKVMIVKAILNEDKPSYEIAMANPEIF